MPVGLLSHLPAIAALCESEGKRAMVSGRVPDARSWAKLRASVARLVPPRYRSGAVGLVHATELSVLLGLADRASQRARIEWLMERRKSRTPPDLRCYHSLAYVGVLLHIGDVDRAERVLSSVRRSAIQFVRKVSPDVRARIVRDLTAAASAVAQARSNPPTARATRLSTLRDDTGTREARDSGRGSQ